MAEEKKKILHGPYFYENLETLNEFHLGMFEYEGLPETIRPNYLEYWLQKYGMVAIRRNKKPSPGFDEGALIVTTCALADKLDPYGEGSQVISTTRNGQSDVYDRYSDDVVIGFNNLRELGCPDILTDAQKLADVDLSLDFLIFWTRLSPLLKVADEKTKNDVITAFSNIKAGVPVTIVTKALLEDIGVGSDGISTDMLTAPDFADKIQYTARLREDILRWHYTRYGQVIQGDTKLAQQSVDEVNGTVSSSLIIPLIMLKCREEMITEINKKFGLSASVKLSGAWRAEVTKYENDTGEADIDDTETEGGEADASDAGEDFPNDEVAPIVPEDEEKEDDENGV